MSDLLSQGSMILAREEGEPDVEARDVHGTVSQNKIRNVGLDYTRVGGELVGCL